MRTIEEYAKDLRKRIILRMGKVDEFLEPQIDTTAKHMMVLDRVVEEIANGPLLIETTGRHDMPKTDLTPLLPMYDKIHRSLVLDLAALGLNYNTSPAKVKGEIQTDTKEKDGLANLLEGTKENIDEIDEP